MTSSAACITCTVTVPGQPCFGCGTVQAQPVGPTRPRSS